MPEVSTWRAVFRQPKLRADQLQIRIIAPIPVEVYRKSKHMWDAREPGSGNSYGLHSVDSAANAMAHIEGLFRECVEKWQAFDAAGNPITEETFA